MCKLKIIVIPFFFLLFLACDQLDISSNQAETFVKLYGSSGADIGVDVKNFNNGYLILATAASESDRADIVLLQTDKFGNLIDSGLDTLSSLRGGNNNASELLLTSDGGFVVVGTVNDTLNNHTDIYVGKFNSNAENEWEKIIGTTNNEVGTSIKKANSGYIIAGSTDAEDQGNGNVMGFKDIYLVKIDDTGDLEWTQNHGFEGNDYSGEVIVVDGGYLIVGTTESTFHSQENNNIILLKTNQVGISPEIDTYGGDQNDYGNAIVKTSDEGFVVVGSVENVAGDNSSIYVFKISDNIFETEWVEQYEESLNARGYDIIRSNGGLVIVGDVELTTGFAGGFLKISGDREILIGNLNEGRDALTYGGYGQKLYAIEPTSDGGYIMVGSSGASGIEMIYLLKVNSDGEL